MAFETFTPADPIERDGDVRSRADIDSLEQHIPVEPEGDSYEEFDELADQAVAAAQELIATPENVHEVSAAERAYDELEDKVQEAVNKGLDATATRYQLDPGGKIKKAFDDEVAQRQATLNHERNTAIREAQRAQSLADLDTLIADPKKRDQARSELLAHYRAEDERRGHRS